MIQAQLVDSVFRGPVGSMRIVQNTPGGHPADGLRAMMAVGDGAYMDIPNPRFDWGTVRDHERVLGVATSVIGSYEYLLSGAITAEEAIRRLRFLRAGRALLLKASA